MNIDTRSPIKAAAGEVIELLGNLPLQYADGPDYCTVTDATGGAFALTVQPELMKLLEQAAARLAAQSDAAGDGPVAWKYTCKDGSEVLMLKQLTDEQKRRGYYTGEDGEDEVDGDEVIVGPFHWAQEMPLYAHPATQPQTAREARTSLINIAAECHRAKWKFGLDEDYTPSRGVARGLIIDAFDELHRIGDLAIKAKDALSGKPGGQASRGVAQGSMGWAIERDGKINIKSVSPHERGAKINWLCTDAGVLIHRGDSDAMINDLFASHAKELKASLRQVAISSVSSTEGK